MVGQSKKSYTILEPKADPLLTSSMQQVVHKCETTLFELKSSATFWAMKRSQRTKIQKVINSLSAKSVLAGEKLVATYSISTSE